MRCEVVVGFSQPRQVVFDYLKHPRNRPAWQSSLRAVEDVVGDGKVGSTWTDVTRVGMRARLRVIECEPPTLWVEVGEWRDVTARLELQLRALGSGTVVKAIADLDLPGPLRPAEVGLRLLAPVAVRADLRRAARLL